MQLDYLTRLLGIQGHHVTAFDLGCRKERIAVIVTIARDHESHTCPKCGVIGIGGYDSKEFEVRHLMFWSTPTFIRFERYRGNCKACGILSEPLNFVDVRGPRVTAELAHVTKELCKVTTVKAVGDILMLHRHTVKAIDKQALQEEQANRPLDGITVLGMDELSHRKGKGHKYKHMIRACA